MDTALRWISQRALRVVAASLVAACSDPTSATDLHPEGPPMVEQVRLVETYAVGTSIGLTRVVFGFGTHPDATADDEHPVTTATAAGNKLRIIMDELLRGNNLEEIACRFVVDTDAFARVPLGATPDDIARCSVAQDVLPVRCPGNNPHSVCLCANDGGCPSGAKPDGTPNITPKGESVGVLDVDQDGAADDTRFIQGAVGIRCDTPGMPTDVSIDLDNSYWTPSGDQQKPAQGGFDALGPAVVLVPGPAPGVALPTNVDCGVVFSSDVVDKDGNQVCAPPGGDIRAGCTPGDTSAVRFHVEPMALAIASPINPQAQSRTADVLIKANVPIAPASLTSITVTEDPATSYTQFTAAITSAGVPNQITIHWTAVGGLTANTHYTITVPITVTDLYNQSPLQPLQIAFTTGN
jgi:hypothetical protein